MKNIAFILGIFLFILPTQAQESAPISKQEVLARVKESNSTLKMAQQDILMAKGDFNQTNVVLLPTIGISHTGIATTNPLMAFGSKLNQEILTAADFNPGLLNDPSQIQDYATRLEVQQPLINFDGIFQRRAAKAKWNATELKSERTQDYLVLEVEKAYMQVQRAYKMVEALQ